MEYGLLSQNFAATKVFVEIFHHYHSSLTWCYQIWIELFNHVVKYSIARWTVNKERWIYSLFIFNCKTFSKRPILNSIIRQFIQHSLTACWCCYCMLNSSSLQTEMFDYFINQPEPQLIELIESIADERQRAKELKRERKRESVIDRKEVLLGKSRSIPLSPWVVIISSSFSNKLLDLKQNQKSNTCHWPVVILVRTFHTPDI